MKLESPCNFTYTAFVLPSVQHILDVRFVQSMENYRHAKDDGRRKDLSREHQNEELLCRVMIGCPRHKENQDSAA